MALVLVLAGCAAHTTAIRDPTASASEPADVDADGNAGGISVEVFYLADTPQGPRLFGESHRVDRADPVIAAANELVSGAPLDPDYTNPLAGLAITDVRATTGAITVQVDSAAFGGSTTGAAARIAAQSLVYTLQRAAGSQAPVRLRGPGGAPVTLLGQDTSAGLRAEDPLDVLSWASIDGPAQGAAVSGTVRATGEASSYEGGVQWRVFDDRGAMVLQGTADSEGFAPGILPWRAEIPFGSLTAGTYTFTVRNGRPSHGGPPTQDTKSVIVS